MKHKTSPSLKGKLGGTHPTHPLTALFISAHSLHSFSFLALYPASSSHLNMTLCIHLSFPCWINNSIESSPHGSCLLFLVSFSVSCPCYFCWCPLPFSIYFLFSLSLESHLFPYNDSTLKVVCGSVTFFSPVLLTGRRLVVKFLPQHFSHHVHSGGTPRGMNCSKLHAKKSDSADVTDSAELQTGRFDRKMGTKRAKV